MGEVSTSTATAIKDADTGENSNPDTETADNQRIDILEKKIKRLEGLFHQLESKTNRKIMVMMNHMLFNQNNSPSSAGGMSSPMMKKSSIIRHRLLRKPLNSGSRERFIIPEVTFGNDDDNNDEAGDDGEQNTANGSAVRSNEENDEEMQMEEGNDDYDENNDEEENQNQGNDNNGNLSSHEDPLALEDGGEDEGDDGDNQVEPWRFLSNEFGRDDDDDEQQEEEEFDMKPSYPFDIESVDPDDYQEEAVTYNSRSGQQNYQDKRFIRSQKSKQKNPTIPGLFIPKNRYLMSAAKAAEAERLHQRLASAAGGHFLAGSTTISPVKVKVSSNITTISPGIDQHKIYKCDRCDGSFTLSTRHAHFELHKKLDLQKKSRQLNFIRPSAALGSASASAVSRSGGVPILQGRTITQQQHQQGQGSNNKNRLPSAPSPRKRARKVCPVCPKSYSRNQYLRNHLSEHSEDYPYICKECFCVFTNPIDYKKHCQTSEKCFMSLHRKQ